MLRASFNNYRRFLDASAISPNHFQTEKFIAGEIVCSCRMEVGFRMIKLERGILGSTVVPERPAANQSQSLRWQRERSTSIAPKLGVRMVARADCASTTWKRCVKQPEKWNRIICRTNWTITEARLPNQTVMRRYKKVGVPYEKSSARMPKAEAAYRLASSEIEKVRSKSTTPANHYFGRAITMADESRNKLKNTMVMPYRPAY